MPTKTEKDHITGVDTTGHEWDGLKELNNPLPKWWLYVFAATVIFAAGQFLLYPSIPYYTGYFRGLLGYSSRARVERQVNDTASRRALVLAKVEALPFDQIQKDPELMQAALTNGRITFANNCQPCHGAGGAGRVGYPALGDDVWLWGGTLGAIQTTITHGARSGDPDAHQSVMPSFGTDKILDAGQIQAVADYVEGLFGLPPGPDAAKGKEVFAANCAACHGDSGQGNQDVGAPPLASHVHLYEGTRESIVTQVTHPRLGVMPAWGSRLNPATIKSLTLYVHSLGGGQ